MAMLYEEKIAKRFAKIKPDDFDFWAELDSCLKEAVFVNRMGEPITNDNKDKIKIAIAFIFICYGMYEMKSTICALLVPQVLLKLTSRADVEQALLVMEIGAKKDR